MARTCELMWPGLPDTVDCDRVAEWLLVTGCDCPPGRDMLACQDHADDLRRAAALGATIVCYECGARRPIDLRPLP